MITDAWIWYHIDKKEFNDTWALASIALSNSGGIRTSAEPGNFLTVWTNVLISFLVLQSDSQILNTETITISFRPPGLLGLVLIKRM